MTQGDMLNIPIRLGKTFTIGDQELIISQELAVEKHSPSFTQLTVSIFTENFDIDFQELPRCVIHAPEDVLNAGQEDARAALLEAEGRWSLTRPDTEYRVEFRADEHAEWRRDSRIYHLLYLAEKSSDFIHEQHRYETRIIPRYVTEGEPL